MDKIYVKGFKTFKKNERAPDFIHGKLLISLKEFNEFANSKEVESYLQDYNGNKQLPITILKRKDGTIGFEVDTYKKGESKQESDLPY